MKNNNMKTSSATDWERVDNLTDEQIDTSDIPPMDAAFFACATLKMPGEVTVALHIDADVLEWYEAQGENAKACMKEALRLYAKTHEKAA